jgi:hypothetical protein
VQDGTHCLVLGESWILLLFPRKGQGSQGWGCGSACWGCIQQVSWGRSITCLDPRGNKLRCAGAPLRPAVWYVWRVIKTLLIDFDIFWNWKVNCENYGWYLYIYICIYGIFHMYELVFHSCYPKMALAICSTCSGVTHMCHAWYSHRAIAGWSSFTLW